MWHRFEVLSLISRCWHNHAKSKTFTFSSFLVCSLGFCRSSGSPKNKFVNLSLNWSHNYVWHHIPHTTPNTVQILGAGGQNVSDDTDNSGHSTFCNIIFGSQFWKTWDVGYQITRQFNVTRLVNNQLPNDHSSFPKQPFCSSWNTNYHLIVKLKYCLSDETSCTASQCSFKILSPFLVEPQLNRFILK